MTTRYVIDAVGIWTGETVEWQETQAIPERTVTVQPPVLYPGEYALWVGAWAVVNERPQPPEEPEPADPIVPERVDRRQILTGLALVGWITQTEAEEALAIGARPAAVNAVIAALPEEQQFLARMKWIGFQNAYRNDEMVAALAAIEGKTEQEIDAFFILCAAIE